MGPLRSATVPKLGATGSLLSFSTHRFAVAQVNPEPMVSEEYCNPALENGGHTCRAAVAGTSGSTTRTAVATNAKTAPVAAPPSRIHTTVGGVIADVQQLNRSGCRCLSVLHRRHRGREQRLVLLVRQGQRDRAQPASPPECVRRRRRRSRRP